MESVFRDILKGKVVIVGIGNILRADDGLGPVLVEKLRNNRAEAVCIDAGSAPENYAGKIAKLKPDTILLVDAVHLGLKAGEYRILKKSEILRSGLTTHDISPNMFIDYLESRTQADIYLLGVQPGNISFGQSMSDRVKKVLNRLSVLIIESLEGPEDA
jgi:hydrogenase 3 maturation protease